MTNNEMNLLIAELAAKCNVSQEEARAALEAGNWNKLTAGQMLENEKLRRAQEVEEVASGCATATAQAVADEAVSDEASGNGQAARPETFEQSDEAQTSARAEDAGRTEAGKRRCSGSLKNLGDHIRRLVACGNRNRFMVRRNGSTLMELPVTALAVLMLFAFWTCVPLLVIGLFLGCRYSFSGQNVDKAADYIRKTAAQA